MDILTVLGFVISLADFAFGLYAFKVEHSQMDKTDHPSLETIKGTSAQDRLELILVNAIVLGVLWAFIITARSFRINQIGTRILVFLLLISPFLLSFGLAFHAPNWDLAVSRAVASSISTVLMFTIAVIIKEGIPYLSEETFWNSLCGMLILLMIVAILAWGVAYIAYYLRSVLTD